eukprot:TRINITY_DN105521_c0_g1_i1.p1 TRINITY_DN105521_c0_g1~~TRINITY_DN105521_c0_g1_i1.p1  ORF type:complete len:1215 (+),score=190.51 TRINITY_DN105521_c0_g1_i1:35-3646(+)
MEAPLFSNEEGEAFRRLSSANALSFSHDNTTCACGYEDGKLDVFTVEDGTLRPMHLNVAIPAGRKDIKDVPVTCLSFSSLGLLAVGSGRSTSSDKCGPMGQLGHVTLLQEAGAFWCALLCWNPCMEFTRVADLYFTSGDQLAVVGGDLDIGYCAVFNDMSSQRTNTLLHTRGSSPGASPKLQDASQNVPAKLIEPQPAFKFDLPKWQNTVHGSSDGSLLATAGGNKQTWVFRIGKTADLRDVQKPFHVLQHAANIRAVSFSGNDSWLATGGSDEKISLYHTSAWELMYEIPCHGAVRSLSFSQCGSRLAGAGKQGKYGFAIVLDAGTASCQHTFNLNDDKGCMANSVCWHPVLGLLAATSSGLVRKLMVEPWMWQRHLLVEPFGNQDASMKGSVSLSVQGHLAIAGGALYAGNVNVLNLMHPCRSCEPCKPCSRCLIRTISHEASVRVMRFSDNGRWLAACRSDGALHIYDMLGVSEQIALSASRWATGVCFARDDCCTDKFKVVTADSNGFLSTVAFSLQSDRLVLEDATNTEIAVMKRPIKAVSFSSKAAMLSIAGDLGKILLYNVVEQLSFSRELPFVDKDNSPRTAVTVAFCPLGRYLAAGGEAGLLSLYDFKLAAAEICTLRAMHDSQVSSISFSADGLLLLAGCLSGSVTLYPLSSGQHVVPIKLPSAAQAVTWTSLLTQPAGNYLALCLSSGCISSVLVNLHQSIPVVTPSAEQLINGLENSSMETLHDRPGLLTVPSALAGVPPLMLALRQNMRQSSMTLALYPQAIFACVSNWETGNDNVFLEAARRMEGRLLEVMFQTCGTFFEKLGKPIPAEFVYPIADALCELAALNMTPTVLHGLGIGSLSGYLILGSFSGEIIQAHKQKLSSSPSGGSEKSSDNLWSEYCNDRTDISTRQLSALRLILPDLGSFRVLRSLINMGSDEPFGSISMAAVVDAHWHSWARKQMTIECSLYMLLLGSFSMDVELIIARNISPASPLALLLHGLVAVCVIRFACMEVRQLRTVGVAGYANFWNVLQVMSLLLSMATVVLHGCCAGESSLVKLLRSMAVAGLWIGVLWYMQAHTMTAPIVRMLRQITADTIPFMLVVTVVVFGFAFALRLLFSVFKPEVVSCMYVGEGKDESDLNCDDINAGYESLFRALLSVFEGAFLGQLDFNYYESANVDDRHLWLQASVPLITKCTLCGIYSSTPSSLSMR